MSIEQSKIVVIMENYERLEEFCQRTGYPLPDSLEELFLPDPDSPLRVLSLVAVLAGRCGVLVLALAEFILIWNSRKQRNH